MIQANELRIGNLVTDEWYESFKTVITVDSINSKGIDLFIEDDGNWTELAKTWIDAEIPFEKLRGIPLDDNWVTKLGFSFDIINDGDSPVWQINGYDFYLDNKYQPIDFGFNLVYFEVKYVHELQNVYRWIKGDELTIKAHTV